MSISLIVEGQKLRSSSDLFLASGTYNYPEVIFDFDDEWTGFSKIATFCNSNSRLYYIPVVDDKCTIPSEVMADNEIISIGVYGTNDETRISTNIIKVYCHQSGYSMGTNTSEKNYDVLAQLQLQIEQAYTMIDNLKQYLEAYINDLEQSYKIWDQQNLSNYIKRAIDCLYPHTYTPTKIKVTVGAKNGFYSNTDVDQFMYYDIAGDVFDPETDGLFVWYNDNELVAKSNYGLIKQSDDNITIWGTHPTSLARQQIELKDGDTIEFIIYRNWKLVSSSTGTIGQLSAYTSAVTQSTIGRSKKIIDLLDGYDITAINSNNGLTKGFEVDIYDTDVLSADKITIYATYCGEFDDDTPTDIACWAESWSTGTNNTKDIINYISNRPLPLEFEIGDGASGLTIECLGLNFDFAAEKLTEFYIELE